MKKIIALMLMLSMAAAFAACGNKDTSSESAAEVSSVVETSETSSEVAEEEEPADESAPESEAEEPAANEAEDETADAGETDPALFGTWSMDIIEMEGETISMDSEEAAIFEEINYTFSFDESGKISVTVMGLEEEGAYELQGTTVLVDGEELGLSFDNGVLTMSDSGMTITFKKA